MESKTSRSRVENQQNLPTYDLGSGNRSTGHILGGECSDTTAPFLQNSPAIMIVMTKYLDENVAISLGFEVVFSCFSPFLELTGFSRLVSNNLRSGPRGGEGKNLSSQTILVSCLPIQNGGIVFVRRKYHRQSAKETWNSKVLSH